MAKKEEKDQKEQSMSREIHLTKHMLVIHSELMDMVDMLDKNKVPRVAAIMGGRISMINEMFRNILKDNDYKQRFESYIKEINEDQKKKLKEQEPGYQPTYMG